METNMEPTLTLQETLEGSTERKSRKGDIDDVKSLWRIIWEQFIEHRLATFGLLVIVIFILLGLFAPVISMVSGIDPSAQNVFHRYKAPLSVVPYTADLQEVKIKEFVKENTRESAQTILAIQNHFADEFTIEAGESQGDFLVSVLTEVDSNEDFRDRFVTAAQKSEELKDLLNLKESFHTFHLLGTDELGRDVALRLIYGTRVSIGIGIIVSLAAAIIGLLVGAVSGYYGGFMDTCLMRVTDSLLSLPLLPVLIVFAAIDLRKIPLFHFILGTEEESIFKLVFILCLFSWMTVARLVRGSILSIKERDFIGAAQTLGARDVTIILTHIVPNTIAPLLVAVTLNVGQSILSEAALSFLGLGIQPPVPSWGNMLFNAQELIYEAPLQAILPGVLILLIVVSFNFVGDGLQDAIDPRSIKR